MLTLIGLFTNGFGQKYGGMSPEMIKELRALRQENARLRKVVADHVTIGTPALVKRASDRFAAAIHVKFCGGPTCR